MRIKILSDLKLLTSLVLLLVFSNLALAIDINNIYDLWIVRNDLGGTYNLQDDLNLETTNPNNILAYQSNTNYSQGDIVNYNSFAYYCMNPHNSGTAFIPGNWQQMWEVSKGWQPIGNEITPFYGRFNGNNKKIYNLYIDRKASPVANNVYPSDGEDYVGLFGVVSNGSSSTSGAGTNYDVYIKDLGLINPNVSGRRATGSLVGRVILPYTSPDRTHIAYIENCFAKADGSGGSAQVSGFGSTGGLVGANNSVRKLRVPVIRFSYADVVVSATHPTNTAQNPYDEIEQAYFNPYNIKYGGLVGCNENGTTQDSYAFGNVSGGDRVGGLAGCSIGGAIFRSFSSGSVTRNIAPGNYQGGIGGVVGISSGYLPPALGGTNSYGSVEDSYWDTTTSGTFTSAGGIGMPTSNFSNQGNFNNWDFTNVWQIIGTYPSLKNSPITNFHFRTTETGNFSSSSIWAYSDNQTSWISAVTYPDLTNSISITVRNNHTVNIYSDWYITNTLIESGGKIIISSGDTLFVENESGDDLIIQGNIDVLGNLVLGQSASMRGDTGSKISFLGNDIINYTSGVSSLYDVEINNPNGVSFSENLSINGVLTEENGTLTNTASTSIMGLSSSQVRYLDIAQDILPIENFAVTTSLTGAYPTYIKRVWNIQGFISSATENERQREVTFYWDSSDDNDYDWLTSGNTPILFQGVTKINPLSYDLTSNTRWATYNIIFDQVNKSSKAIFNIGLENDQTLPVNLSSFTADVYQEEFVKLIWVTESESNLNGYTILRSTDNNIDNAMIIDFFQAQNTNETYTYTFIDDFQISAGDYYYWLQTLEYDGSNQIFGPIIIQFKFPDTSDAIEIPTKQGITAIYPNPFNPTTTIDFYVENESQVIIEVYNIKGQAVKKFNLGTKSPGSHSLIWNAKDKNNNSLTSGLYFTKVNIGSHTYTNKMILKK